MHTLDNVFDAAWIGVRQDPVTQIEDVRLGAAALLQDVLDASIQKRSKDVLGHVQALES